MKKMITITAALLMGVAGLAFTTSAHEPEETDQYRVDPRRSDETIYETRDDRRDYDRRDYDRHKDWDAIPRLQRQVEHLNRMLDHVRGEMRAYGANRRIRYRYDHIQEEAYRLNAMFRRGVQYYDRSRIRGQIEHMRGELHQLEMDLHVRANGYYQWR
jgi:hypothetical protein